MRSLLVWLRARLDDRTVVMTEEMKRLLGRSDAHVISPGTALDLLKPGAQTEGGASVSAPGGNGVVERVREQVA